MLHDAPATKANLDAENPQNPDEGMTFCGCGKRKGCPRADVRAEDGAIVLTDADEGATPIVFRPDQAAQLREWLQKKGF